MLSFCAHRAGPRFSYHFLQNLRKAASALRGGSLSHSRHFPSMKVHIPSWGECFGFFIGVRPERRDVHAGVRGQGRGDRSAILKYQLVSVRVEFHRVVRQIVMPRQVTDRAAELLERRARSSLLDPVSGFHPPPFLNSLVFSSSYKPFSASNTQRACGKLCGLQKFTRCRALTRVPILRHPASAPPLRSGLSAPSMGSEES